MFKRRRARVVPKVDPYIERRYEDMAVSIRTDIARNKGLFCYYTPWLEQIMERFELPEEYRRRHSLVATDSNGRHIGCSGATTNTLVYYNPISTEQQVIHRTQSKEARRKSVLSEKFRDSKLYFSRSKSLEERVHPYRFTKVRPGQMSVKSFCSDHAMVSVKCPPSTEGEVNDKEITQEPFNEHSALDKATDIVLHSDEATSQANTDIVFKVSDSRPQSGNSYYARIDEHFRKHREPEGMLRLDDQNTESKETEYETKDELGESAQRRDETLSGEGVDKLDNNGHQQLENSHKLKDDIKTSEASQIRDNRTCEHQGLSRVACNHAETEEPQQPEIKEGASGGSQQNQETHAADSNKSTRKSRFCTIL